jgi:hypothetical protein
MAEIQSRVTALVKVATNGRQVPFYASSDSAPFIFGRLENKGDVGVVDPNVIASDDPDELIASVELQDRQTAYIHYNELDGLKYVDVPEGALKKFRGFSLDYPIMFGSFKIAQTEVTVRAYRRFAGLHGKAMPIAPPFNAKWADHTQPVVNVTWRDAVEYCGWIGGRLPSEPEWIYTFERIGNFGSNAWTQESSEGSVHPVGQAGGGNLPIYDMRGNVWEWTDSSRIDSDLTGELT